MNKTPTTLIIMDGFVMKTNHSNADVIHQTAPQFFPEFCLLSRQIFQLVDEVRENFPRVILLLDECLQFLNITKVMLYFLRVVGLFPQLMLTILLLSQ